MTCEVGDLSGKHGRISVAKGERFMAKYRDPYVSTQEGLGSFFGNRSIVIHARNGTRLTCANFTRVEQSPYPTGSLSLPTGTGTMTIRLPTGTGAASSSGIGGGYIPTLSPTYTPTATPTPSPPDQNNGAGRLVGFSLGAIMAALVPFAL